ncbi:unnamed protein product [Prunus armeniaca]
MLKELIMNLARQGRIELDVDEIGDANITTVVFGSYDPVLLPVLSPRLKFQSTRGIYQVNDLCAKELVGEPNYQGGDGFIGDSHFNDEEVLYEVHSLTTNAQSTNERRKKNSR